VAGREFDSLEHLNAHLLWWAREVADARVHGTTGEVPLHRFEASEKSELKPLCGKPPFLQHREVRRLVANDSYVDFDTNRYSVPWKLIGEEVLVTMEDQELVIRHQDQRVASHRLSGSRYERITDPGHHKGIFKPTKVDQGPPVRPELLRSLEAYELAVGGGF